MLDVEFLQKRFGFSSFRNDQDIILENLFMSRNSLAILPTGGGKSLIYLYFGEYSHKRVVIVSPLLSLMQDQIHQLQKLGIRNAIAINSQLTLREKDFIFSNLEKYQYLFFSPEMLYQDKVIQQLKRLEIGLFVIDEAHCISQWGYDFRPEYSKLGIVRKNLNNPLSLALTATAKKEVVIDICHSLNLSLEEMFIHQSPRQDSQQYIELISCKQEDKPGALLELIKKVSFPSVIFFPSIRLLEETKLFLQEKGYQVDSYHSKRNTSDRQAIQQQFLLDEIDIICATSAFGMGINKDNIRSIIHYRLPSNLEDYVQQIGRAGRDGEKSQAISLVDSEDVVTMRQMLSYEFNPERLGQLYQSGKKSWDQDSSLSSTQKVLLNLAAEKNLPHQEANQFFERHYQNKINQIGFVETFAFENSCYHGQIEKYFSTISIGVARPCQSCSICLSRHILEEPDLIRTECSKKKDLKDNLFDWKEKFKRLINFSDFA